MVKEYVAVSKADFEKMKEFEIVLDLLKKHGKVRLSELTGLDTYKVKQNPDGTYTHVPKEVKDSVTKVLTKPKNSRSATEEDGNSFYKLRSDWLNVKL